MSGVAQVPRENICSTAAILLFLFSLAQQIFSNGLFVYGKYINHKSYE